MDKVIQIRDFLANKFNNECLADEILSFSVKIKCNFDDFENFNSYPFMIGFPGLVVHLNSYDYSKTQLENCLSIKFICNLNLEGNFIHFQCFFFWRIF